LEICLDLQISLHSGAEDSMYKHILIATDGSELAQKGVDHGLSLAKGLGSKVVIVVVTEPFPFSAGASAAAGWLPGPMEVERYQSSQKAFAEEILTSVKTAADRIGVASETLHIPDRRPAEAILETAEAHEGSLIVMASHGRRGITRLLLGSQTAEVLAHSPVPVLVVR
jgi:nucleotide-binding universal stress UspA family protein